MDTDKMNKKGKSVLSLYWFLILGIIASGFFIMVYLFYGTPFDIRELEARVLTNKIADCISYAGRINSDLINEGNFSIDFNLIEKCHLIFASPEWEDEQYYVKVYFYKLEDTENPVFNINVGNNNWLASCSLESKNVAQCLEKSFYSLDELNYQYIIKILTVVRKSEKNVKM